MIRYIDTHVANYTKSTSTPRYLGCFKIRLQPWSLADFVLAESIAVYECPGE